MNRHPFTPGDDPDVCAQCPLPRRNRVHADVLKPPPITMDRAAPTGRDHPAVSFDAAASVNYGTHRAAALRWIADQPTGRGATAAEVQAGTGSTHQSTSSAVNSLMRDKLIRRLTVDGKPVQRRTPSGRFADAWVVTPAGSAALGRVRGVVS